MPIERRPEWPERLALILAHEGGPAYRVVWHDDALWHEAETTCPRQLAIARCVAGEAAWLRFWQAVDALGVWTWRSPSASAAKPGRTRWRIDLAHADRHVSAEGYGAFPPDGAPEPGEAFEGFCRAVRRLAGDRAFG